MSYHMLYTSLGPILDEDKMWQGIKFAKESKPHRVHRSVARDSRGWPRMSWTLTIAFPAHVFRWGYLSQGKGSLSSKLQSFFLP